MEEGEETVLTVMNRSWDSWDNRPEVAECHKEALRAELTWCTVSPLRPSPEQSYPSFIRRLSEEILRGEAHQPPPHPGQRRRGGGVAKAAQK